MPAPERVPLIDHLPLDAPFSVHMFVSYFCNFKCGYCVHCMDAPGQAALGFEKQSMPLAVFKKAADDMAAFATRPKAMILAGHGEPLTHPAVAEMVAYAKRRGAARRVDIVTNASLLTAPLSDALIEAGLDRLRVSLQGIDAEDYLRVCGVKIDFPAFLDNLRYFFQKKRQTEVFVKIIDIALRQPSDAARFHALCDALCDTAEVEFLFPFIKEIDHRPLSADMRRAKHGGDAARADICAMPFYMLVVLPNGDVTGCCAIKPPVIFGNVTQRALSDIWHGEERRRFLRTQARDRDANPVCRGCAVPGYGMQPGDYLDEHREALLKIC